VPKANILGCAICKLEVNLGDCRQHKICGIQCLSVRGTGIFVLFFERSENCESCTCALAEYSTTLTVWQFSFLAQFTFNGSMILRASWKKNNQKR